MQLLCKIWPPNGFKVTHAETNVTENDEIHGNFSFRMGNPKVYSPIVHWNLEKLVKIYSGTIARLHLFGRRPRERVLKRVKDGTSSVLLLQSGLGEQWWAEPVAVSKIFADGKTPYEQRVEALSSRPIIPFGAKLNIIRYQQKI